MMRFAVILAFLAVTCARRLEQAAVAKDSAGILATSHHQLAANASSAETEAWFGNMIKSWIWAPEHVYPAPAAISDLERSSLIKGIPCPFIAAVIKAGLISPSRAGKWRAYQAKHFFNELVDPVVSGVKQLKADLFEKFFLKTFFGVFSALGFHEDAEMDLREWDENTLHGTHTGIRLPLVKGDDGDAWSKPCRPANGASTSWQTDADCGHPGPKPRVFDMLVGRIGEDRLADNYQWQDGEIQKLCHEADTVFYETGNSAYGKGGAGDVCEKIYAMAFRVLGVLTTKEWRDLLLDAEFPASYDISKFEPM